MQWFWAKNQQRNKDLYQLLNTSSITNFMFRISQILQENLHSNTL